MITKLKARLANFDSHTSEVLSAAGLAFVLRGFGAGLAFVYTVAIGRLLGAEGAGLYFLALSVISIGAVVAKMGLDNTLLRFIASGAAEDNWRQVKGVFSLGIKYAGLFSFILTIVIFLLAPWLAEFLFSAPDLTGILRWMSFGVFSFSMMTLLAESLKGLKQIGNAMLVSGVLYPAFALILIFPLVTWLGPAGAGLAYVLGTAIAALVGWRFWCQRLSSYRFITSSFSKKELWASSLPLWQMSIINRAVLPWAPLFMLGIWGTAEEVGIFGAAMRVAMLMSFFLMAVNNVLAPTIAELYSQKKFSVLARLLRRFALTITVLSAPILLLLIFGGTWVMSLFGEGFSQGGTALAILVLGQAVNTTTGSVGYLLMMSGHERDWKNCTMFALIVLVACSLVLIPLYGILGAAISSALAVAVSNLAATWLVWHRLRISVFFVGKN